MPSNTSAGGPERPEICASPTVPRGNLLFQIVLVTCCVAGCLMAIPYIGTVLLLPVLVFSRAYSLHYFAQYGRPYDVFPPVTGNV